MYAVRKPERSTLPSYNISQPIAGKQLGMLFLFVKRARLLAQQTTQNWELGKRVGDGMMNWPMSMSRPLLENRCRMTANGGLATEKFVQRIVHRPSQLDAMFDRLLVDESRMIHLPIPASILSTFGHHR
jgi:hypothetical protein